MIRWDDSDAALKAITEASGAMALRLHHPDGCASVWCERFSVRVVLAVGDWVIIDRAQGTVYPVRGEDHGRLFEPACEDGSPQGRAKLSAIGTVTADGGDLATIGFGDGRAWISVGEGVAEFGQDAAEDFSRLWLSACWQAEASR